MRNHLGTVRGVICGVALMACTSPAYAQMDSTNPWQRDRAAHQEKMDKQAQGYHDRWEEYKVERYEVDAVGVIDKAGARREFDEAHAPVDLHEDAEAEIDVDIDIDIEIDTDAETPKSVE